MSSIYSVFHYLPKNNYFTCFYLFMDPDQLQYDRYTTECIRVKAETLVKSIATYF